MHTFIGRNGTYIFYDGDFKGKAIISVPNHEDIEIDAEDLVDFSKAAVKSELISLIEQA